MLVTWLVDDPMFCLTVDQMDDLLDPKKLTGRCEEQVIDYLLKYVAPVLDENESLLSHINMNVEV